MKDRALSQARLALDVLRDHPRHLVLFALVGGLACGAFAPALATGPAVLALLLAGRPAVAVAAMAAALGGAAIAAERRDAIDHGRLPAAIGSTVELRLVALEPLRERASGQLVARAAVAEGVAEGEQVLLKVPDRFRAPAQLDPGDVVAVEGRLAELGRFDAVQRRRGALAGLEADRVSSTGRRRGGLAGVLDGVRHRAEAALRRGMPDEQAALMEGMVLGRDDRIDQGTQDEFRTSGLAHLLAVSGTNVMLLATLVLGVGALVGAPLRWRLAAALALIALYVPLTGAGPSIQRAGVMGAAGLVAALAGRPASRWYALGLAAAVTLALNPYAALEAGWQLSFAAVVGLFWLARPLREALGRRGVPAPLAEAAALTIAATLATAPLLAVHFGRVSLVSLPANLLVAPVVAPIMWLGMLAAGVAQVVPAVAAPLDVAAAPLVGFVDRVARVAAGVPDADVAVPLAGLTGAVAGYLVIAAGCVVLPRLVRAARQRLGRRVAPPSRRRATAPVLAVGVAAVAALGLMTRTELAGPPPGATDVSFLDVGQGDATLVQRDGTSVLVDTGPPGSRVVDAVRQAGVGRLDALVITHAEADHEGSALAVIERLRPRLVVDGGAGWPTPVQRVLPQAAAAAGARIERVVAGDELRLGPLEFEVLWPPGELAELPPGDSANGRALVLHLRSDDLDVLLTADAEAEQTRELDLPPAEVLKVAHHGSDDAGLPAALEEVRPQIAAIMVGRGNTYGHPTPQTLDVLRGVPNVYRTDRDGTVRLRARGGRIEVDLGGGS